MEANGTAASGARRNFLKTAGALLLASGCSRRIPVDEHGNPIFNSRPIESLSLDNCAVDSNYYTMKGNIENRGSAFFVADQPTREQALHFATTTPVFFFIVHINHVTKTIVALEQHPDETPDQHFAFRIIHTSNGLSEIIPLAYPDAVPDLRAVELRDGAWDPNSAIVDEDGKAFLLFNYQKRSVLLYPSVVEDVKKLIKDRKLYS